MRLGFLAAALIGATSLMSVPVLAQGTQLALPPAAIARSGALPQVVTGEARSNVASEGSSAPVGSQALIAPPSALVRSGALPQVVTGQPRSGAIAEGSVAPVSQTLTAP